MINTIIFDLDGTLLAIDDKSFEKTYFSALIASMSDVFDPKDLIRIIWSATKIMVQDESDATNETVFMRAIESDITIDISELRARFEQFYQGHYDQLRSVIQDNTSMQEAVQILREKGYTLAIATNPLFPKIAVDKRIDWAHLNRSDFTYISSFENNTACKPKLKFYQEVLTGLQVNAETCLMVGNDNLEDMIAKQLGMQTYLINDYAIIREDVEPMWDTAGSMHEFLDFVKSLPKL